MTGSPAIAAWIAHIAFWVLLGWGWIADELEPRVAAIFVILWLAGLFGLPYVPYGAALFSSYVAALDIALVLIVFKGDIHLT